MWDESSGQGADDGAGVKPSRAFASLTAAIVLSIAATTFRTNAVIATLAFFAWALFLLRGVIDFPVELGLMPKGGEADHDSDGSPEVINPTLEEDL